MTIYTKQNVENDAKKEPALEVQVTVDNAPLTPVQKKPAEVSVGIDRRVRRERRKRLCIQLFLLLGCLLGLSICLFGTLYLYKNKSAKTYTGWCGVRYKSQYQALNRTSATTSAQVAASYLDEEVDINDNLEKLTVPKFDDNDQSTFLHDFSQEVTFIRDDTDRVCYAMPLDTEKVPQPTTFLELLLRMRKGDLIPDAEEVRDNFRVLSAALNYQDVLFMYGEHFAKLCDGYNTFELVKITEEEAVTTTTPSTRSYVRMYAMYPGGRFIVQYRIVF